jgi:hypothetical protein
MPGYESYATLLLPVLVCWELVPFFILFGFVSRSTDGAGLFLYLFFLS